METHVLVYFNKMSYVKRNCIYSMIGNGAGKRKNTVRMEKKIVMNKGKKENENFAILEPLEYI